MWIFITVLCSISKGPAALFCPLRAPGVHLGAHTWHEDKILIYMKNFKKTFKIKKSNQANQMNTGMSTARYSTFPKV